MKAKDYPLLLISTITLILIKHNSFFMVEKFYCTGPVIKAKDYPLLLISTITLILIKHNSFFMVEKFYCPGPARETLYNVAATTTPTNGRSHKTFFYSSVTIS
jgi:hypothetical protein